jgi:polysaccharide biosynthesis/export protein
MRQYRLLIIVIVAFAQLFLNSCRNINSNILFKIPDEQNFQFDTLTSSYPNDYKIGAGDRISFIFSPNEGEQLAFSMSVGEVNKQGQVGASSMMMNRMDYLVRADGYVQLPLIGDFKVDGLTVRECEQKLTEILSKTYNSPFVQLRVTNQRVVVFPGKGSAQLVYISNNNTTLLEVLAMSGGILEQSRANSIKIMRRGETGKRKIFKVDLSTIDGLKQADMVMQANDYIYVDFKPRVASSIMSEITPWLGLFSTTLLLINYFRQ